MGHNTEGACRNADQDCADTAQERQGSPQGPDRRRSTELLTISPPAVRPQGQRPVDASPCGLDRLPAVSIWGGDFVRANREARQAAEREALVAAYFDVWARRLKARDWV